MLVDPRKAASYVPAGAEAGTPAPPGGSFGVFDSDPYPDRRSADAVEGRPFQERGATAYLVAALQELVTPGALQQET
jgi:hypothetical protein